MKPTRLTPWMDQEGFERRVIWTPGYDCRVTCEHKLKGEHGQHGDELHLLLRRPDAASSLTLYTRVRDGKITFRDSRPGRDLVTTAGMSYHFAFRPYNAEADAELEECAIIQTGRCYIVHGRGLTSISELDDHWNHGGWLWSTADQVAVNDEAFLIYPEVEYIVLTLPSGIWQRMQADLVLMRARYLERTADAR